MMHTTPYYFTLELPKTTVKICTTLAVIIEWRAAVAHRQLEARMCVDPSSAREGATCGLQIGMSSLASFVRLQRLI